MDNEAAKGNTPRGAILITGASSGIGRATAMRLAARGWLVFATARKPEDLHALGTLGMSTLIPLRYDLNRRDELPELTKAVENQLERYGLSGIFALVNNAGGSMVAPVELMDLDRFTREVDARLVGALALVQAFLPSIRRADGRILWIATPGLMPTPYVTGIHACDFAVNCIARTLALELGPAGPTVVLVRCGGIRTRAGMSTLSDLAAGIAGAEPQRAALYADKLEKWGRSMTEFDTRRTDPERVAEVIERALLARRPRKRYRVGYMSGAAAFLEALPQTLTDRVLASRF